MEQEQLKPIREEKTYQLSLLASISPPKELTNASEESLTRRPRGSAGKRSSQKQKVQQSPEKGPMQHASRSFASKPSIGHQAPPSMSGEKRSKQIFEGVRPSQVCIPQQTDSDELEDDISEEDMVDANPTSGTPESPQETEMLETQVIGLDAQNSAPTLPERPRPHLEIMEQSPEDQEAFQVTAQNPGSGQMTMTDSSIDPPCGISLRTGANVNLPTSQYSPTIKSEKSPLGFTQNDQRSQSYSQMETMKSMDRSQMIGDEYCLLKDLGEGTFGNVKLGKHLSSGQLVAVKILEKKRITDQADVERVIREIKILKSIRHSHIIKLYEIIETKARIFLIMEYACGGELFDYIVRKDRLSEKEACRFYNQIVSGIEFLHSKGIAHRDLKPENLLLDKQKNLKIVDFGLSNTYKPGQTLKTACGSPCYAAPEMIAGKRYNGIEVDIWSSGVTLYAMLCGFLPFEDPDTALLYKKILKGDFELPDFLTNRSIKFLKEILCTDPQKRLSLKEVQQHPWLTQFDQTAGQVLERTSDNSRLVLSTGGGDDAQIYNTQVYGIKGNSSLVDPQKEAMTNTQMTLKPTTNAKNTRSSQQQRHQYFANANQTVSSSLTATVLKTQNNHHKSVSETHAVEPKKGTVSAVQGSQTHSRPSTSLKKPAATTKASKSHSKRPKQQTTLSAIICSPRKSSAAGVSGSLKRSTEEQGHHHYHKSERKPTGNQNLKEKLRTLKKGSMDTILTQQQKQVVTSSQKGRPQKVPTAVTLLNNTMPMPKLMIDLASPSTGGSTDLQAGKTGSGGAPASSKEIFKNQLARVAKNSAAAAQLHIQQQQQILRQNTAGLHSSSKKQSVSLKKQMLNQHLGGQRIMQQLITQSRSVIGGAAGGSAHSSLSNKRKKSPRVTSLGNSQTVHASASKAFPSNHATSNHHALKTLSFENGSKLRNKHHITAAATLQSVHPYTVMAMPLHSSQNNLKETVLSQMSGTATKKTSSNRHSLSGADPSLAKMPKAFLKSHQSLQHSRGSSSQNGRSAQQPAAMLRRHPTQKVSSNHTSSVETQLRNVQIALSAKKAPNFMSDYSNALYSKAVREHRQVQSLEILKKRNASIEILQPPMRVCAQAAVSPEWCTTEQPAKIIETLEALLPLLNVQFVQRKSPFLYEIKLARPIYGAARSVKCELELMLLKNAPFVTVIRLNQKVKLKPQADEAAKQSHIGQYLEFCRQLKQGLNLV